MLKTFREEVSSTIKKTANKKENNKNSEKVGIVLHKKEDAGLKAHEQDKCRVKAIKYLCSNPFHAVLTN